MTQTEIKHRRTNVEKDSRAFRLTHEAFLYLQALAAKQGVTPGVYLEFLSRQLAQEHLSPEERSEIIKKAENTASERMRQAKQSESR